MNRSQGASQILQAAKLITLVIPAGATLFGITGFCVTPGFWTSGPVLGTLAVLTSGLLYGLLGGAMVDLFLVMAVLPILVAADNDNPAIAGIALVNIFLGWTVIGWIVALVWALSHNKVVSND